MKILELTRSFSPAIGGLEKYVADKTQLYDLLGIGWEIISTNYSQRTNSKKNVVPGIRLIRQYTPYNISPSLPFLLPNDIDIVMINMIGRFYSDYAILYYAFRKTPIIVTPCLSYHTDRFIFIKSLFERWIINGLMKKIDYMVVFTEYEKNVMAERFSFDRNRIFVNTPFITAVIKHHIKVSNTGGKYILYFGRSGANKKTDELIEAYLSTDQTYDLVLTIEKNDVRSSMHSAVENHPKIHFKGYCNEDQKEQLMQNAEALVFPTTFESFGYVAFEASAYSKPLLCSNIPVLRELLDERGVIFFENQTQDIARAINTFSGFTETEKQVMGSYNFNNLSKYSFEKSLMKFKELFEIVTRNQ